MEVTKEGKDYEERKFEGFAEVAVLLSEDINELNTSQRTNSSIGFWLSSSSPQNVHYQATGYTEAVRR